MSRIQLKNIKMCFYLFILLLSSCNKLKEQRKINYIFPSNLSKIDKDIFDNIVSKKYLVISRYDFDYVKYKDTIYFSPKKHLLLNNKILGSWNLNRKIKMNNDDFDSYISMITKEGIVIVRNFYDTDSSFIEQKIILKKVNSLQRFNKNNNVNKDIW